MPEIAEVSHIVDQLHHFKIRTKDFLLNEVKILSGRYVTHGPPKDWDIFISNLPYKWAGVNSKGKFIYFTFRNKYNQTIYLWNTLSMTGGWTTRINKYSNLEFVFKRKKNESKPDRFGRRIDKDVESVSLFFNDKRHFGTFNVSYSHTELETKLNSLGPSWLSDNPDNRKINIDMEEFKKIVSANKDMNICVFLTDQSLTSGIGNYLLSEIIYKSKLNPYMKMMDVNVLSLYNAICVIIMDAYYLDGASISDYKGLDGEIGEYQNSLSVYGKQMTAKGEIIYSEIGPHNRRVYFVKDYDSGVIV